MLAEKEVEREFVAAMGPELGKMYGRLWAECLGLHSRWSEYIVLFGTKPERIDLLKKAAPTFFGLVHDCLRDDVLLRVSRFVDPSTSGTGKHNLSFDRLLTLLTQQLCDELEPLIRSCKHKCSVAQDWRNRSIAHLDLDVALGRALKPLPPATRKHVSEAIQAIAAILDTIRHHYLRSKMGTWSTDPPGSAVALLYVLRDGLDAERERRKRGIHGPRPPI